MNEWVFGELSWKSVGLRQEVRSPIAVRPVPLSTVQKVSADGSDGTVSLPVQFGYNGNYQVDINGLAEGAPFPGSVEDGENQLIFFDIPEGTELARVALFDADVGDGSGSDDLDLQVYGPGPDFPEVGTSGSPTSAESVDLLNPTAGQYAVYVVDYASAEGPTPFTLFNFNLSGNSGNTQLTAPSQAHINSSGTIDLEWIGLTPGTRALGILSHGNGEAVFSETEIMVNTQ